MTYSAHNSTMQIDDVKKYKKSTMQQVDVVKRNKTEQMLITFDNNTTKIEKPYKSSTELPYYFANKEALTQYFFDKYQREWLRDFVSKKHYIDIYEHLHSKNTKYTCWNVRYDLRPSNLGTRIDYIFVSMDMLENVQKAEIDNDICGSDHCPVILDIDVKVMQDEQNILTKNNNILSFFVTKKQTKS